MSSPKLEYYRNLAKDLLKGRQAFTPDSLKRFAHYQPQFDSVSDEEALKQVVKLADAPPVNGDVHTVIALAHVTPAEAKVSIEARLRGSRAVRVSIQTLDNVPNARGLAIYASAAWLPTIRKWIAELDVDPATSKRKG